MRIAVDLPAPFSPTTAWIVPGLTTIETSSFAVTRPKRLVIFLSSSTWVRSLPVALGLVRHRVGDFDLAANDLRLRGFDLGEHRIRDQPGVVLVHRVTDAAVVQAIDVDAALEFALHPILDYLVDGV